MNPELRFPLPPPLGQAAHPYARPPHNHRRHPPASEKEKSVA